MAKIKILSRDININEPFLMSEDERETVINEDSFDTIVDNIDKIHESIFNDANAALTFINILTGEGKR